MTVRIKSFRSPSQIRQSQQAKVDYEQRRNRESETRQLYKTARWQRRRAMHLAEQPLCERCLADGLVVPATVANHRIPHRGDVVLFWEGELESACQTCHNSVIQAEEHAAARASRHPRGGIKSSEP